jgi:hypothetical protein
MLRFWLLRLCILPILELDWDLDGGTNPLDASDLYFAAHALSDLLADAKPKANAFELWNFFENGMLFSLGHNFTIIQDLNRHNFFHHRPLRLEQIFAQEIIDALGRLSLEFLSYDPLHGGLPLRLEEAIRLDLGLILANLVRINSIIKYSLFVGEHTGGATPLHTDFFVADPDMDISILGVVQGVTNQVDQDGLNPGGVRLDPLVVTLAEGQLRVIVSWEVLDHAKYVIYKLIYFKPGILLIKFFAAEFWNINQALHEVHYKLAWAILLLKTIFELIWHHLVWKQLVIGHEDWIDGGPHIVSYLGNVQVDLRRQLLKGVLALFLAVLDAHTSLLVIECLHGDI